MSTLNLALTIAGIVSGVLALYIRLTLSDFIIKTLNGRYPTRELIEAKFEAMQSKLDQLPCRDHFHCPKPPSES